MKPIRKNWIGSSLAISALAAAVIGLSDSNPFLSQPASAQEAFGTNDMQQVVNQYCLACHNDALATSGLS